MTAYGSTSQQGRIVKSFRRPANDDVQAFRDFYTGIILDHRGKSGAMSRTIRPLDTGMRICGPATTTLGPDLSLRRAAIDLAQAGDVLVCAAGGVADYACFGDGTGARMQLKKMGGAVIDGSVRDAAGLRTLGLQTFCMGTTPQNYFYPMSLSFGAVNVPVIAAGQLVHPGDLIFGDDDGVVVVPREDLPALRLAISKQLHVERSERASWTEYAPYNVLDELASRGYRIES